MSSSSSDSANSSTYRVGVVGASGYTGVELLRLLRGHPNLTLTTVAAGRSAGQRVGESWPGLTGLAEAAIVMDALEPSVLAQRCDAVFLALPHGISAAVAPGLVDAGLTVVDLGADFRLRDAATYARFYGDHPHPEWLERAVYGLVEVNREQLRGARLIANPGCYPTAVALAAGPLVANGWCDFVIASCLSGVSGAGRNPTSRNAFCEVGESARPYGIGGAHRHGPEMEQTLGVPVSFTPHLVPMSRGMVATVLARPAVMPSAEAVQDAYRARYAEDVMVVLRDDAPCTADVRGSNRAHVHVAVDADRGVITAVSVIDNLVKGASGQAIQGLNVALGLDEAAGLPLFPFLP